MASVDRTPVDQQRDVIAGARTAWRQALADLAAREADVTALSRVLPEDDSRLQAARTAAATAGRAVTAARQAESASIADLAATLAAWLTEDPAQDVARLESQYPIVLLPARMETRSILSRASCGCASIPTRSPPTPTSRNCRRPNGPPGRRTGPGPAARKA